jgi:hypothetical protein
MTEVYADYLKLANGEDLEPSNVLCDAFGDPVYVSRPWWDCAKDLERICKARGVTRRQVIGGRAIPRPSHIENLVICAELRKWHGDLSEIEGFDKNSNFILPRPAGVLYPVRRDGEIVRIGFSTMSELFKRHERRNLVVGT